MDKRLQCVASLIPSCDTFFDIGGNHGLLACALLEAGTCKQAVITDISAPSLDRALINVSARGLEDRVVLRVCDGFAGLSIQPGDAAAVAGMGARTIAGMLHGMPPCPVAVQPQRDAHLIREQAAEVGFYIAREALVKSNGRFYITMLLERGLQPQCDAVETLIGPCLLKERHPLLEGYIRWRIGVETVARNYDAIKLLEEGLRR